MMDKVLIRPKQDIVKPCLTMIYLMTVSKKYFNKTTFTFLTKYHT